MFADVQNDPKKVREIEADAWEDFLDMTMSQALIWAVQALAKAGTLAVIGVYPQTARSFPIGQAMNKNPTM